MTNRNPTMFYFSRETLFEAFHGGSLDWHRFSKEIPYFAPVISSDFRTLKTLLLMIIPYYGNNLDVDNAIAIFPRSERLFNRSEQIDFTEL
ncbi:hypothetical protein [Microvirus mar27]|uniref:Uncharacterized protein n=1 Tax=Microvirus mar27 TaxID=2851160 RepID=A0A8F5XRB5_9VIRU|nr:hypothetical protein [Microvirus mar27]